MERSSCHGVAVKVANGEEGTNHYICTECENACDILPTEAELIKKAENKQKYLTVSQQTKLQTECDHVGSHSAPTQSILMLEDGAFVIITHVCTYCGATILNNQLLPVSIKKSPIAAIH